MYTLYYSPGSCSLIIHCLLEELARALRGSPRGPNIERFFTMMIQRPAVAKAMASEGIEPFGT